MSRGAFKALPLRACCPGFVGEWACEGPGGKAMNGRALSTLFGRVSFGLLASLVVLLCSAAPLRAQVDAGTILGTVSDASGATIHGATVTLTNEGTNASLATT